MMHHTKIKKLFLDYYKKRGHKVLPDVSLVPAESDASSLFISAGMQPLKSYFIGLQKPPAKRLCNSQKCIRTGDIEEVGDNRHLTLFFMLGNWSIGDYGAGEAAEWAYDLLVNKYGMNKNKIWASIFKGDRKLGVGKDTQMRKLWPKIGIPSDRVVSLDAGENFWFSGITGPCGPDSEIYYDFGKSKGCGRESCKPGCECERFSEIWNPVVKIYYNKNRGGKITALKTRSIDAGAGFERIVAVLQGVDDVYMTTCLKPLIREIEALCGRKYSYNKRAMRVIADHVRAATFIAAEGVVPAKKEQGYVLRRLIRRTVRYSNKLGIGRAGIKKLIRFVINDFKAEYPHLQKRGKQISGIIGGEYDKFNRTLEKGSKILERLMKKTKGKLLKGVDVFHLYDTYGFPMELTKEVAAENGFKIDEKGYQRRFEKHREISKKGQKKKFVSGLADHSEQVIKYHTANHLVLAALKKVLSSEVSQRGSNLTDKRLRFDFNWGAKMTDEQKKKTENLVNKWIKMDLPVTMKEMSLEKARRSGAEGVFSSKYGSEVKVYTIGKVSKEICAGPHVKRTGVLGHFKIIKEKSSSAGVRRIKAILE